MSAKINIEIPQQNFEKVIDQVGAIMLLELSNQNTISSFGFDFGVYKERQTPIDKSEDSVINVSLANSDNSNFNEFSYESNSQIYIDVYVNGYDTDTLTASDFTKLRLHKLVGKIRYILSNTVYKTLGFPFGFIKGTYLNSIAFDDNYGNQDGAFNRMARLTFNVRHIEDCENEIETLLEGNDTVVRLDLTNRGYKFNFNND